MGAAKNKVSRKHVKIRNSELIKKELKSEYKKWQLWAAKKIGVRVADSYQYLFRVEYFGLTRLKVNDIVVNSEGVIMLVIKESNRLAMLVTKDAYSEKPKVYGNLILIDNLKSKK